MLLSKATFKIVHTGSTVNNQGLKVHNANIISVVGVKKQSVKNKLNATVTYLC